MVSQILSGNSAVAFQSKWLQEISMSLYVEGKIDPRRALSSWNTGFSVTNRDVQTTHTKRDTEGRNP